MKTRFIRSSLRFLTLSCLLSVSFVSQSQAQEQSLPARGNSQVTVDDEVLFGVGAREIAIDGSLDLELDTFEPQDGLVIFVENDTEVLFPASAENTSTISIDLTDESGSVIGTFTSSTLDDVTFIGSQEGGANTFSVIFDFEDASFTSTDAGTEGIVGDTIRVTISDLEFTGSSPVSGLSPNEFLANVSNNTFVIDESNVRLVFTNDGTRSIQNVGILQSDPNQEFSFTAATTLLGDANLDMEVNFLDISPFVTILLSGLFVEEADTNRDGEVTFLDIPHSLKFF